MNQADNKEAPKRSPLSSLLEILAVIEADRKKEAQVATVGQILNHLLIKEGGSVTISFADMDAAIQAGGFCIETSAEKQTVTARLITEEEARVVMADGTAEVVELEASRRS